MKNKFLSQLKLKNRSNGTYRSTTHALDEAENAIGILENATIDSIIKYIESISKHDKGTQKLRISKLAQFYNFCYDETDDPKYRKLIKKLKEFIPSVNNHMNPNDILLPEDIKKMINVATLERDRCIIATLFESGMRVGELVSLQTSMVRMDEKTQEVTFMIPDSEGCKTGDRIVLCTDIFGYVQDWLKCNTSNQFIPLSVDMVQKICHKLGKKAGITKPTNPHNFRHSSITHSVNLGTLNTIQISMRYWGIPNSYMLSTYIHLSETMRSDAYRNAKGLGNSNGNTVINPIACRCVECGKLIQAGTLCKQCQDIKKLSEANTKAALEKEAMKAEIETMKKDMELTRDFMELMKRDPRLLDIIKGLSSVGEKSKG